MAKSLLLKFLKLILCLIIFSQQIVKAKDGDIKVLVLIIASDYCPIDNCNIYPELQKIWRSYMHNDPKHVEAYFIRGNPNLKTRYAINGDSIEIISPSVRKYKIENDVIWSQTSEGWIPESAGILNKTILSMEAMLPRLNEFDYILRTNLSSFYVFPRFLNYLKTLPKNKCYCASGEGFGSGSGFIMSPDIVQLLIKNKNYFLNNAHSEDDVLIGIFLRNKGIKLISHPRIDFLNIDDWNKNKNNIPGNVFQFRIKNNNHYIRIKDDIYIHNQLLKVFYNN